MLKYIKVLRHVSILTDHHQGVGLYLVKVTELFKNTEFKILKINPGVVAAIHVAGVLGDPCGAVRWTAVQRTAHWTKACVLTPELATFTQLTFNPSISLICFSHY